MTQRKGTFFLCGTGTLPKTATHVGGHWGGVGGVGALEVEEAGNGE